MEKLFLILAVVFAGIAAAFLWFGESDGLFICAVAGAVCFFLSIRFQVGARVNERRAEMEAQAEKNELSAEEAEDFGWIDDERQNAGEKRETHL